MPLAEFRFVGFLPTRPAQRDERLGALLHGGDPIVFFEAPHRMRDTVEMLAKQAPERRVFVARELTKRFVSLVCDIPALAIEQLDAAAAWRGEFVCVLEGTTPVDRSTLDADTVMRVLGRELPPAQAARIGAELLGASRRTLYRLALDNA